jgi:hypothetical protein
MEIQGEIIVIGETETFGEKGFKKRQLVIKTDSQYPQSIPIDFTQDKCIILNNYAVGQFVTVSINVQGSEWKGKYYVNLQAWKIDKGEREKSSSSFMPDRQSEIPQVAEVDDDLPF